MYYPTKTFLLFILIIVTKCTVASATKYDDYDDDEKLNELITDILTFFISGAMGVCSESTECSAIIGPQLLLLVY